MSERGISEEDARAEGVDAVRPPGGAAIYDTPASKSYRYAFAQLWLDIHGEGAWARNDWVFAIDFRKVTP